MTQAHFITGTTLTLLLAVAVLGNAPSATAESTDVADPNAHRRSIEAASATDPVLLCDLGEPSGENASTRPDVNARLPGAWSPKPEARSTQSPKPEAWTPKPEADATTRLRVDADANVAPTPRDEETSELTRRVSAALLGQKRPASARVARATGTTNGPADPNRVWRCGGWEELWQGRGSARSCEWK